MKLSPILKNLILEAASIEAIENSIRNKQIVSMYYMGDEDSESTGRGLRLIEPVCFGRSLQDNLVLRAWEISGVSYRGQKGERPLPGWRFFIKEKIASYNPTSENFTTARPGYNPNGDKLMKSVIINTKF